MVAPPAASTASSPLGGLDRGEREQVIGVLAAQLPRAEAVQVLAALAGTRADLAVVPMVLQERAQATLLLALPAGLGAIIVSKLGLPAKSAADALDDVLTEEEKADPEFMRRVAEEARRRRIPPWLAAIRLRWDRLAVDELVALMQREQGDPGPARDAEGRPRPWAGG